jgi:hypothetical protein
VYGYGIPAMLGRASILARRMAEVRLIASELHLLASALDRAAAGTQIDGCLNRAGRPPSGAADLLDAGLWK